MISNGRHWLLACALVCAGLTGCVSTAMQKSEEAMAAKPDQALVIFMRSSAMGGAVQASVFDVSGAGEKLVGIVSTGTKVGYYVAPGERTFMVVSEAADFMQANLVAGRTYYALVTPRMGFWKARFSLRPVRAAELGGSEFADWNGATYFVVNTPQSQAWAAQNSADIAAKRASYWPDWSGKSAAARAEQTLNADDGR